ncbi:MAG: 4-(cytidine 5'-diphospho)-2-C-methyl-D-erythritol kinase [Chloroflexi bacterium]|nr:4-(cytidine 5'-diphospho)-2-C-methyl-D-erythritol kinase [Chloroflexota bacterium]
MRSRVVSEAPAKVNWTLEVLGKRADGYHEVRTILQTIRLGDYVELRAASELSLSVRGATRAFRRASREAPETNLAYRAAALLRERAGVSAGAEIRLSKRIPVAAGLGGGSSDAAATLRGLRDLWGLSISDEALASIAAGLGSDVPFFLRGGTALASGRGDVLAPLPDGPPQRLVLAWPERAGPADKTARMYAALRPEHYSDGSRTERLADRLRAGEPVRDEDVYNVFEQVLPKVDPETTEAFEQAAALGLGQPHLAGSGPAFFFLLASEQPAEPLLLDLDRLGLRATETATLPAAASREER